MTINYPELGWVHEPRQMYDEGAVYRHPAGSVYRRTGGNWVLIAMPGEPEP